jgi:hypothetical protein
MGARAEQTGVHQCLQVLVSDRGDRPRVTGREDAQLLAIETDKGDEKEVKSSLVRKKMMACKAGMQKQQGNVLKVPSRSNL